MITDYTFGWNYILALAYVLAIEQTFYEEVSRKGCQMLCPLDHDIHGYDNNDETPGVQHHDESSTSAFEEPKTQVKSEADPKLYLHSLIRPFTSRYLGYITTIIPVSIVHQPTQ